MESLVHFIKKRWGRVRDRKSSEKEREGGEGGTERGGGTERERGRGGKKRGRGSKREREIESAIIVEETQARPATINTHPIRQITHKTELILISKHFNDITTVLIVTSNSETTPNKP